MDQPSHRSEPQGSQEPSRADGDPRSGALPRADEGSRPAGRRPSPALVGGILVLLVALLALGAFLGTRAYLSGDGGGIPTGTPPPSTAQPAQATSASI